MVSGPTQHTKDYLEGLTMLASMRLCPNAPAQYAIQAALGGRQSIRDLVLPGGGHLLNNATAPGRSSTRSPVFPCVKPKGALCAFPA
ncbi:hypothetical protein MOQ72_39755 [Saccharopolyspora sp. K220]|uniref:hypothetical protein n=1 Tax=Saccharopolyspora soli TaxID=2926618 RepID=UPI001F5660A5|nr:hypothetical protein [Saccharopolyspora soli]MCI2423560.1 hypothetical protein [Saccharopolyspora soli]